MNIGIFGGSFDPPHLEHVRLAAAAVESLNLDKLFVVPAHTPPHKRIRFFLPTRIGLKCAVSLLTIVRGRRSAIARSDKAGPATLISPVAVFGSYTLPQSSFGWWGRICSATFPLGGIRRKFCLSPLWRSARARKNRAGRKRS